MPTVPTRGVVPLLLISGVVVLVMSGLARGLWLSNLHNGLLALAFAVVGGYVLFQRPGHREGRLFLAAGVVEAVMFLGRQIGHQAGSDGAAWWGWLGVWPLVVGIALTTFAAICFPDGRLPSPRWRWVVGGVALLTVVCASVSAVWPVEYPSAGVTTPHPIDPAGGEIAGALWTTIAHPSYIAFQVLWVVALVVRWRSSGGHVRLQLAWLVAAAAVSALALVVGLVIWNTHLPGVLSAVIVPITAGWAIVHGQHVAAYAALSWLSRTNHDANDLPTDLAKTAARALAAPAATLWMGPDNALHPVGVWPETGADVAATNLVMLREAPDVALQPIRRGRETIGAISVRRPSADRLSSAEARLLADLAAQATFVIEHINLLDIVSQQRRAGHLSDLSPREEQVLELIARGRSNAAICQELHLSVKTVEPIVSAIFVKLGLHADADSNRRVLAALAYLRD